VCAQEERSRTAAWDRNQQVAGVGSDCGAGIVLFNVEPQGLKLADQKVGDATLTASRTWDPAECFEGLVQSPALCGAYD
jgi:hypothetical protein